MSENDYEMAIVQLLEKCGWTYLPPALQPERDYRNPLYVEKLEAVEAEATATLSDLFEAR